MRKRILSILVILSLLITVPVSFYATEQEASREFVVVSALGIFGDGADFGVNIEYFVEKDTESQEFIHNLHPGSQSSP